MAEIRDLEEFSTFAESLNLTVAARQLNMSQTSLSRHIKRLENELDVGLVTRRGNMYSFTPAGLYYYDEISSLLLQYQEIVNQCIAIQSKEDCVIRVQEPPYPDAASDEFYRMIDEIEYDSDHVRIRYASLENDTHLEDLKNGKVHLALDYKYGKDEDNYQEYEHAGLCARFLASVEMGVWAVIEGSTLPDTPSLDIKELSNTPVYTPSKTFTPLRDVFTKACREHGFEPRFINVSATSQMAFYHGVRYGGVYLFPFDAMKNDFYLKNRKGMRAIRLMEDGESLHFEAYAIARKNAPEFQFIEKYFLESKKPNATV